MSRAPACRSRSPSAAYSFSPCLDDMLLDGEATGQNSKDREKDHHEEGLAGSREVEEVRDEQGR